MKRIFYLGLVLMLNLYAAAQKSSDDVVIKLNGEELTGKVTEINDTDIKFIYKGETLTYTIKKSDILKIKFASGREEIITKVQSEPAGGQSVSSAPASNPADRKNKLAILPFRFITDRQSADEEMSYKVQDEAFSLLNSHSGTLELQATSTTNALLLKAGITQSNFRAFTPAEVCTVLGVEYIVQGTITQNKGTATTTQSNNGSINTQNNTGKSGNDRKTTVSSSSSSSTYQNYKTSVNLAIFKDNGTSVYSDDHTAFWSTADAYKNAIKYLLKRTPVYKK
ncbi:MAG TPA: hypothetical protein PLZ45_12670 [Ferruginibacter sp.]|nr:hypothetical protein [Chitinophagaceae bacterium]HRI25523.1 hypothetical protein [Ferruginibacter sp.]